ncbi:beta-ketoacyl synthase domain-containing protein [Astrocystis sublimbata]|nr:beta-ketoacyl synthase domain-containing protein [Astrocystis sublimbata]
MQQQNNEPIAIIGSACRFAGEANSPSKLWELLKDPRDVLSEIPASRFSATGFHHEDSLYHGHSNVRHSYLLSETDDVRAFDSKFFGVKPVEARARDPQQRLLLEVAYEGLEAAGLPMEHLRGSDTAVYVGLMCADYESLLFRDFQNIPTYHSIGNARSTMSNRLSYFFDWRGPSVTVDTACSSSLTALHLAVQTLRSGDSEVALACGTNLLLGPEMYVAESKLKMLSPTGRSRMWDAGADGYARGDGVAVAVLKTLSRALADGDNIECVVRQTGINQDGGSGGSLITMPSATAQQALIRDTYAKAGLDPLSERDRCQFFEAHGTGTPAGDPIEAEAIASAFFGSGVREEDSSVPEKSLYVGSVKTVLGHTEGTAGLAAVLKASLALQHGLIPPNMMFNTLNPNVAPFYDNLEVPTTVRPWPKLLDASQPRRASVNSFGFGGANAHAVLESFGQHEVLGDTVHSIPFAPFVFSAGSEKSLVALVRSYADYLETADETLSPRDLAWTLIQRRSALSWRTSFPSSSIKDLKRAMDTRLDEQDLNAVVKQRSFSEPKPTRILGIFTGQGAQYDRMGTELIEQSPFALKLIRELEAHLSALPEADRPSWSLEAELRADASSSRLSEATIAQPLCTAVQILLVELLRQANVQLDVVLGHSSGEIGAAYAAGHITAQHAMYIAYYRGLHSALSTGHGGKPGAMLAVATSREDAMTICALPEFEGRVSVAAVNSSSSVTLSGDEDAIEELEDIFADEKKFRRRLRVDKAYHSHHMLPSFDPYVNSLEACGVKPARSSSDCTWLSSVFEEAADFDPAELKATYWAENMTRPVLFAQALENAMSHSDFDMVIEIGPHPALKGPATQVIEERLTHSIPYTGLLSRGLDAREATSDALGFLWCHLGREVVDVAKYEEKMGSENAPRFTVLKNLPTYPWNHDAKYWHESRQSRNFRLRESPVHPILGDTTPDSSPFHRSWRNLLRAREVPWVAGHQLQSQTVFPAAGYLAAALDASKSLTTEITELIEISNFDIHQALVFDEEDAGIETLISLSDIKKDTKLCTVSATFTYAAGIGRDARDLTLIARGEVCVYVGQRSHDKLPKRGPAAPHMIPIDTERFYSALADMGYDYSGNFQGLFALERKLGMASGSVGIVPSESFLIDPATLDSALQAVILAYSYPSDGRLWSLHVPTSFSKLRLNPSLCGPNWATAGGAAPFTSVASDAGESGILGDVSIYDAGSQHAAVQIEGMRAVPFTEATAADDKKMFSRTTWRELNPNGDEAARGDEVSEAEEEFAFALERLATYYTRIFDRELEPDHPARSQAPFSHYLKFCQHVNALQRSGKHLYAQKKWLDDTPDDIADLCAKLTFRYSDTPDVRIMRAVGENMLGVFRGETTILEHLRPNNLLDDYYVGALGMSMITKWLGSTVAQLAHRYPRMNILEIGAGTGGATKSILKAIGPDFGSYTYTDVSAGFFETASSVFAAHQDRMVFKTLDASSDPVAQGFTPGSYDLAIASFVIHATDKLEETMRNVRRLLKPGGYVALGEITNNDQSRSGFIFGTLPGWWAGVDEGRTLSPCVSSEQWDEVLRRTGFSGIDTLTPEHFEHAYAGSVLVAQAVDERLNFLREPLLCDAPVHASAGTQDLVILGGSTLRVSRVVAEVKQLLKHRFKSITSLKTSEDAERSGISDQATILSLTDLDKPVFKDLDAPRFEIFKKLFLSARAMLWVTKGRRGEDPYANMTVGFGRTAVHETPGLRLQFLDFESSRAPDAKTIGDALLRFQYGPALTRQGDTSTALWTDEPEIVVDTEGRQLIPRLVEMGEANKRYNSVRRQTAQLVDPAETDVEICCDDKGFTARCLVVPPSAGLGERMLELRVTHSLLTPLKTPLGPLYLVFGIDKEQGKHYAALTRTLTSRQPVSENSAVLYEPSFASTPYLVRSVAESLLAASALHYLLPGQSLLVHNSSLSFSKVISQQGAKKEISRRIQELIPKNVSSLLGFSELAGASSPQQSIIDALPQHCRVDTNESMFPMTQDAVAQISSSSTGKLLKEAIREAQLASDAETEALECAVVKLSDIASGLPPPISWTVVDWQTSTPITAHLRRLDAKDIFHADKTYWLVGLTGTLGLSLCDWMIDHGARFVAITSRTPGKVEPSWVEGHRLNGATVCLFANDVTDEKDLGSVYDRITATLPPVAGVVQGALVLRDSAIWDMSFAQMSDVVRPRVEGSLFLDGIFHDTDLDFFIMLSSMTGIIGNMGQANYTTSNTFMGSLAAARRRRGLAASVISVGVIIGAGYVTREMHNMNDKILNRGGTGLIWMSESDFHQSFAEAIMVGRDMSLDEPEISTGLGHVRTDAEDLPTWHDNPRFSRFIVEPSATESFNKTEKVGVSIKARLESAESAADICAVIQETFATKLRAVTQLETEDAALVMLRTDEIGLDSLIAVDIRSWFLKNYEVSIPVLKILGGAVVSDLVDQAVQELPAELTPNLRIPLAPDDTTEPAEDQTTQSTASFDSSQTPNESDPIETPLSYPSSEDDGGDKPTTPDLQLERSTSLSFSQSMFWFVHELMEDKTTLNHTGVFSVAGYLDPSRLRHAVAQVGQHHEALRTRFYADSNGQVLQGIMRTSPLRLEQVTVKDEADVRTEYNTMKNHLYDIGMGEVLRLRLLVESPTRSYLLIGCHHVNVDGTSNQKQEFATIPEPLPLVRCRIPVRRPMRQYTVTSCELRVDAPLTRRIREVARQHGATSFHFYLTAFSVLLHRLTAARDFAIGIAEANRKDEETLASFGPFVNILPLRFQIRPQTFGQALSDARSKTYAALSHSRVPFEALLNELRVTRSPTHSPIFQTFVDYRQGTTEKVVFAGCELELLRFEPGRTAYDLSLDIIDNPNSDALVSVLAQGSLYSQGDVEVITRCFEDILVEFSKTPGKRITSAWTYREADVKKALTLGRGRNFVREWQQTLVHRFVETADRQPQKTAVVAVSKAPVTYAELENRSNTIATALLGIVEPGQFVGVYQESGSDWVASMLAIWKVGAVYVPLDSKTRISRLAAVVRDCQPAALVVDKAAETRSTHLQTSAPTINISSLASVSSSEHIPPLATPDDTAVCLYTSGSTGTPKGVLITHSSLSHEIEAMTSVFDLGPNTTVLQQSSFNFDMSVLQILLGLSLGGSICLTPSEIRGDALAITELITQQNITFTCATPSEYASWLRYGDSASLRLSAWTKALSGGEAATHNLLTRFRDLGKSDLRLFNGYGPTETTFCSAKIELEYRDAEAIPAGRPSPGEAIYIVDEQMRLLPVGLPGEVVIGGASVAAGYLNHAELSGQAFVEDVFASEKELTRGWTTMYRTKDRGRLLDSGCLLVEGRMGGDTELKIRGMRVDLQEVERVILACAEGAIAEVVVSSRAEAQAQVLVGHVVFSPASEEGVSRDKTNYLKALCERLPLPEAVCPTILVPLDTMPTTSAGKLDRAAVAALPIQFTGGAAPAAARPPTVIEKRMIAIWAGVLEGDMIQADALHADTDFFQAGGTSMLLIEVQAQIRKSLGALIPLVQLFKSSTVSGMARLVDVEQRVETTTTITTTDQRLIDWDAETSVPQPLFEPTRGRQYDHARPSTPPRVVVLTGATGFLGQQLLKELVASPSITQILCIAIRHLDRRIQTGQLAHDPSSRVVYHSGDLREPNLGLSPATAASIFALADAVIHNGADVSHLKNYHSLRAANVDSTRELLRLCAPRRIPLHYVSTAGTAMFADREVFREVSVAEVPPPRDGVDGYTSSKWASEVLLEKASAASGMEVWIHRPSSIMRPKDEVLAGERDGEAQFDLLQSMLHFSRELRAVPVSERLRGTLDLVGVENVARNIVGDVCAGSKDNNKMARLIREGSTAVLSGVTYVHQTGDLTIPLAEMGRYLERESGGEMRCRELPMGEWAALAERAGLHVAVATVFANAESLKSLVFPRFVKGRE